MIRVSYWQFRLPLYVALGGLAAVAVAAGLTGSALAHLYDTTVAACGSAQGLCDAARTAFNAHDAHEHIFERLAAGAKLGE